MCMLTCTRGDARFGTPRIFRRGCVPTSSCHMQSGSVRLSAVHPSQMQTHNVAWHSVAAPPDQRLAREPAWCQREASLFAWARGVVVSHPLSMREALGSIPSVSNGRPATLWWCHQTSPGQAEPAKRPCTCSMPCVHVASWYHTRSACRRSRAPTPPRPVAARQCCGLATCQQHKKCAALRVLTGTRGDARLGAPRIFWRDCVPTSSCHM